MRYFSVIFVISVIVASSGCTYWRQLSKPPTWGMSIPELWQYEGVQNEKRKLHNPTIRLTDLNTGKPLTDARVTAIPRPGLSPIGRPKTKTYKTNSGGIATLKNLPSGAESWITLDGLTSVPLVGLLDDGQINSRDILINLLDHVSLEPGQSPDNNALNAKPR